MGFLIGELLDAGLLHADVRTVAGDGGLARYREEPRARGRRRWSGGDGPDASLDAAIVLPRSRSRSAPTAACKLLERQSRPRGDQDLGGQARALADRGAGAGLPRPERAAGRLQARRAGARLRGGGALPGAEGQRHAGAAQADARRWACCRTGASRWRWSPTGACRAPRARCRRRSTSRPRPPSGGPLARVRDGDIIRLDAEAGRLEALVDEAEWAGARAGRPPTSRTTTPASAASCSPASARSVGQAEEGALRSPSGGACRDERADADASCEPTSCTLAPVVPVHRDRRTWPMPCRWRRRWSPAACACSRSRCARPPALEVIRRDRRPRCRTPSSAPARC